MYSYFHTIAYYIELMGICFGSLLCLRVIVVVGWLWTDPVVLAYATTRETISLMFSKNNVALPTRFVVSGFLCYSKRYCMQRSRRHNRSHLRHASRNGERMQME